MKQKVIEFHLFLSFSLTTCDKSGQNWTIIGKELFLPFPKCDAVVKYWHSIDSI